MMKNKKCCHFYNNDKICPYEEIGCKFKHEVSNKCRYDKNCHIKLSQFKHTKGTNSCEAVLKSKENLKEVIEKESKTFNEYEN